jgi:Lysylphosphatidylglycerol synthase TM region
MTDMMSEKQDSADRTKNQNRLSYFLVIPPAILVILVIVFIDNVGHAFRLADLSDLLIALFIFFCASLLISLKFRVLLDGKASFTRMLRSDGLSFFINQIVPIPSEALRVTGLYLVTGVDTGWASARMILDFLLNLFMRILAGIVILMIPAPHRPHIKLLSSGMIFIALTGVLIWFYNHPGQVRVLVKAVLSKVPFVKKENAARYAEDLAVSLQAIRLSQLAFAWALSLLIWILFAAFFYEGLAIFNINLPISQMLVVALLALVIAPPSTPIMIIFQQILVSIGLLALKILDLETVIVYAFILQGIQVLYWIFPAAWAMVTTNATFAKLAASAQDYLPSLRRKRERAGK